MNMNDEVGDPQERIDDEDVENPDAEVSEEFDPDETAVLSEDQSTDNIGDVSVEINVEELIANIEGEESKDVARKKEIRRRLEEVAEEQSFEDTYAIDLGDEEE
jgi:hypothetical protein